MTDASHIPCKDCGMIHDCDIQKVLIEKNAAVKAADLLGNLQKALIVSDGNTRALGVQSILQALKTKNITAEEAFFDTKELIIPDEKAIDFILSKTDENTQVIIGVGAGVLNDLCKYVSFLKNIPYMIVATAPSMDGYASKGAALILEGMKVTKNAHVPTWIVADTDVLAQAPLEMIQSGIGDILGKYSCLNDWKLSHLITDEIFCQNIFDMVKEQTDVIARNISGCMSRSSEAIGVLMEALVEVGIAMSYMGNSRPASGSEHHFSHFFEIVGILNNRPYLPHGIDVAYSAVLTCRLRQAALQLTPQSFHYAFNLQSYSQKAQEVFGPLTQEVLTLQEKVGFYNENRVEPIKDRWGAIRQCLQEAADAQGLEKMLNQTGLTMEAFKDFYDEDFIRTCMVYAKDLKDRYTVLWMLNDIGALEKTTKEIQL